MRPLHANNEVIIVGGGVAGLAAARHVARLGRSASLVEGGLFGGQVATIDRVDGLFAPGDYSGYDLAAHLVQDCRKLGVGFVEASVEHLDTANGIALKDNEGGLYHPRSLIIASGASLRKLGVPGEDRLVGRGVSRCATCDGPFFRGLDAVVVGGGDSAVQEAMALTKFCRRVIVVSRSRIKAKRHYIERLASQENVQFVWNSVVEEIVGEDAVTMVRLRDLVDGGLTEIECAGIFPFIGTEPNSSFLPMSFRDQAGFIVTDDRLTTLDDRIFAAGAVRAGYGGDITQAIAEGVSAAEAAVRRLQ